MITVRLTEGTKYTAEQGGLMTGGWYMLRGTEAHPIKFLVAGGVTWHTFDAAEAMWPPQNVSRVTVTVTR